MTYMQIITDASGELKDAGITNARMEAIWLLAAVTGLTRADFFLKSADAVEPAVRERYERLVARRAQGEPLQYLIGETEFYGMRLKTGPGVFIPRPETEVLVEKALATYPGHGDICDLCTGSGAVALSLAHHLESDKPIQICATEISGTAMRYALENRERLACHNVHLYEGNLFEPLPSDKQFSMVTANPPYVHPDMYEDLAAEVRLNEPREALLSEEQGLRVVGEIIRDAVSRLLPGGWLMCEISPEQTQAVRQQFAPEYYCGVHTVKDYAGKERIVAAQRRG